MTLRSFFSILAASPLSVQAEPLITLQESNGTDKLRVELLNLEKDIALLRRADGQEFDTPLAYLSEDSRSDIRHTW
ncbi:hypothetical protein N9077_02175, partial [bacterium]|nr:hypothetical protein [bacterium]